MQSISVFHYLPLGRYFNIDCSIWYIFNLPEIQSVLLLSQFWIKTLAYSSPFLPNNFHPITISVASKKSWRMSFHRFPRVSKLARRSFYLFSSITREFHTISRSVEAILYYSGIENNACHERDRWRKMEWATLPAAAAASSSWTYR